MAAANLSKAKDRGAAPLTHRKENTVTLLSEMKVKERLLDRRELREFITYISAVQEMLKGTL